jgi:hypothetical protein
LIFTAISAGFSAGMCDFLHYVVQQMNNRTRRSAIPVPLEPALIPKRPYSVVLLIESSRQYGRGLLHGIASHLRMQPIWHTLHLESEQMKDLDRWLKRWPTTGVIARIDDAKIADTLTRLKVPIVDLMGSLDLPNVTRIWTSADDVASCQSLHQQRLHQFRLLRLSGHPLLRHAQRRLRRAHDIQKRSRPRL